MEPLLQHRVTSLLYQMAQSLILHDDFTILPQISHDGQAETEPQVLELVLIRRRWNTLQIVRLLSADHLDLQTIEAVMKHRLDRLPEARQSNSVQNAYELVLFMFSHWRSDENIRAISETGGFAGVTKSLGVGSLSFDLSRGVHGPLPPEKIRKGITLDPLVTLSKQFAETETNTGTQAVDEPTRTAAQWHAHLTELSERKRQQVREALRPERKTPGVYWLIGLNVLVFLLVQSNPDVYLNAGVLDTDSIRAGEYWRLLTAVFLHQQMAHIAFNMVSLYWLGQLAERIYGLKRFLPIFLLAGLSGSLLSFALNDNPSLGASGAIFGLFGALVAFGQSDRRSFSMTIGPSIYGLLMVNLVLGFVMPNVDYWAHLGGLVGGYLIARSVGVPGYRLHGKRWLFLLGYVLYAVVTFSIGSM